MRTFPDIPSKQLTGNLGLTRSSTTELAGHQRNRKIYRECNALGGVSEFGPGLFGREAFLHQPPKVGGLGAELFNRGFQYLSAGLRRRTTSFGYTNGGERGTSSPFGNHTTHFFSHRRVDYTPG